MATIDIHNLSGEKVGTLDLADEVFGAINEDLLWEAVKHYRAAQRAGTHATKNKKLVSGAGKKLWKQKGTGRARVGSIRSPLWRHGGTVHGPQPRSYDYAFPRKKLWKQKGTGRARIGSVRSPLWRHGATVHGPVPRSYDYKFPRKKLMGALRSALAAKFADGKLIVVNAFDVKEPKTKIFRKALDKLKVNSTALLVEAAKNGNRNLELSSRNIDGVELVRSNDVHPYHLMRYEWAVFTQPVFEKLQASLKNSMPKGKREAGEEKVSKKATASPRRKASREKAAEVA